MSDPEDDLIFDGGINSTKCATFVRLIRRRTLLSGIHRDDQLVADTAAACLDGVALRWFEQDLESETQDSWKLLRLALLQRWPDEAEAGLIPSAIPAAIVPQAAPATAAGPANRSSITPPVAPPTPSAILADHKRLRGRVRVLDGNDKSHIGYLSRNLNESGVFDASMNAEEAQVVSLVLSSESMELYLEGPTQQPYPRPLLGVTFADSSGKTIEALCNRLSARSVGWGALAALSSSGPALESQNTSSVLTPGVNVSKIWHISLNGEIFPAFEMQPSTFCRLDIRLIDDVGVTVAAHCDTETLKQHADSYGKKCLFIFEPV